jgi:hypothetical protein
LGENTTACSTRLAARIRPTRAAWAVDLPKLHGWAPDAEMHRRFNAVSVWCHCRSRNSKPRSIGRRHWAKRLIIGTVSSKPGYRVQSLSSGAHEAAGYPIPAENQHERDSQCGDGTMMVSHGRHQ